MTLTTTAPPTTTTAWRAHTWAGRQYRYTVTLVDGVAWEHYTRPTRDLAAGLGGLTEHDPGDDGVYTLQVVPIDQIGREPHPGHWAPGRWRDPGAWALWAYRINDYDEDPDAPRTDQEYISRLADAMRAGAVFPPVIVHRDRQGRLFWDDGAHRLTAAGLLCGASHVLALVTASHD